MKKTFVLDTHGHRLEIRLSLWSGSEIIVCDGKVVSEKRSFLSMTAHAFEVEEAGELAVYEVNTLSGFGYGYVVRRNGILVASQP
jgi:hypothetical protein